MVIVVITIGTEPIFIVSAVAVKVISRNVVMKAKKFFIMRIVTITASQ